MLYKSIFRNFKKRLFQVILLTVIMIMSAFVYVVMGYSIEALKTPAEAFFDANVQEDFNVTMFEQITPFDLQVVDPIEIGDAVTLSDLYHDYPAQFDVLMTHRANAFIDRFEDTQIESRLFKDTYYTFDDKQHLMRVIKDSDTINQTLVLEGRKPVDTDEIALIEVYAEANDLDINDTIEIHGVMYTITGFVLFPDYTLGVFGDEFILNNGTRTLGLMSDTGFDVLPQNMRVVWGGIFTNERHAQGYFEQHNLPFVLSIALTQNTLRSGAIYDEIAGAEAMSLVISLVIAGIAVIIVAIMVSRMLFEQRGAIGILKALGYTNREIAIPYIMFVLMIALPGLLIGYVIGFYMATPLKTIYASLYLLPQLPVEPSLSMFLQSIIFPLVFLMSLGYLVVLRLLREHPVTLIRPPVEKPPKKMSRLPKFLRNLKLSSRIKHAYMLRNKSRFLVFYTGVFSAVFLMLTSFSMVGVFDRMFKDYYESIDVNYIAYCEPQTVCDDPGVTFDKVLEIPYVMLEDHSVTIIGLDAHNLYHPLFENNRDITHLLSEAGVIITDGIASEMRLGVGDDITLSYGGLDFDTTVKGIQDELGASKVYVNRAAISLLISLGTEDDLYNVMYTSDEPTGDFMAVIDIDDLLLQSEDLARMIVIMSIAMSISAITIGVVVLVLIIILSIEHYNYDISLFKVIGYNDQEVRSIFINTYLFYMLVIFVITIPIAWVSFEVMMWYLSTQYGMIFPMSIDAIRIIITLLLTVSIFYLSVPLANRKIRQMSLADALKIYQSVS